MAIASTPSASERGDGRARAGLVERARDRRRRRSTRSDTSRRRWRGTSGAGGSMKRSYMS